MSSYSPMLMEEINSLVLERMSFLSPNTTLKKSSIMSNFVLTNSYFLEALDQSLADISIQSQFTTATGVTLSGLCSDRSVIRKQAIGASGEVVFYRKSQALADIIIPEGTVIQTAPDAKNEYKKYKTTSDAIIETGNFLTTVDVLAETPGVEGNTFSGINSSVTSGDAVFSLNAFGNNSNTFSIEVLDTGANTVSISNSQITIGISSGITTVDDIRVIIESDQTASNLVSLNSSQSLMPEIESTFFQGGADGGISIISNAISGVDFVCNTEDFINGANEESDEELRARTIDVLSSNFGIGTSSGYKKVAESVAGVASATVMTHTNKVASASVIVGGEPVYFSAKGYGEYGNSLSVEIINTGSLSVSVVSTDISITVDEGVTTIDEVFIAIESHVVAKTMITLETSCDKSQPIGTMVFTQFQGGAGGTERPNQITVYITQNNVTGIPDQELIDLVKEELEKDSNRLVADYIVIRSPEVIDITVLATISEYETGSIEADVRSAVKESVISYISGLSTGEKVYTKSIEREISNVNGVLDFSLTTPSANIEITEVQKSRLIDSNCTIS